jgi:hypothetical protein
MVDDTNTVVVSKNFTGELLLDECHAHFMEDVFDESCSNVTTVATSNEPTVAQRMSCDGLLTLLARSKFDTLQRNSIDTRIISCF